MVPALHQPAALRTALSADIEREMAFHMAERADDLVARGMSEADARREARRRFGNPSVQKERTRDADVLTWLESLGADVRYAVRALRASPGFALVAILSLGLGIGANTAIFSLINAVVLKTLPGERPEELVQVTMGGDEGGATCSPIRSGSRFATARTCSPACSPTAATGFNLTAGGEVRRARGDWVSGDYFSHARRQAGGGPSADARSDDVRGCPPVAVLGYGFWQSEYGGSPAVIGKTISLDRKPHVIVGVTDPSFFGVNVGESIAGLRAAVSAARARRAKQLVPAHRRTAEAGRDTARRSATRLAALAPAVFEATVPQQLGRRREGRVSQEQAGRQVGGEWALGRAPRVSAGADRAHGRRRRSCCSSPARTSRTCCSLARPCADARWRSGSRSARHAAGSFASC